MGKQRHGKQLNVEPIVQFLFWSGFEPPYRDADLLPRQVGYQVTQHPDDSIGTEVDGDHSVILRNAFAHLGDWSRKQESNLRTFAYKASALPT